MKKRVQVKTGLEPGAWKLLPLVAALAIAGCGGGSSGGDGVEDGNDGGNGVGDGGGGGGNGSEGSGLSGSQQAIAVAYTVAGRAESLADQAIDQSSGAAGGDESGVSAQSSLVSAANTTEPFDDCVAVDDSVEAGFRIQEGDALDLANVEFPEQFTSSPDNDIGQ
ncbi:hypothetical protein, partial [Marinobacter sp.]|uniref:hypothetical protein n=1 Tax=Marinobacter sp. TaxID=50741 RepID=UPI00356A2A91